MYGVCKICGCTDSHACNSPIFGNCWWVDDSHELCSHCKMKLEAKGLLVEDVCSYCGDESDEITEEGLCVDCVEAELFYQETMKDL